MIKKIISSLIILFIVLTSISYKVNTVYAETNSDISVSYCTHIQNIGWESEFSKSDGQMSGTEGQALRLEGIKIKLNNESSGMNISYRTHIQGIGWQEWKQNGQMSGTEGQSLRLEAIQIKLEGVKGYKVMYRVHVQNIGWQEWKQNGQMAGTEGQALRLEAIEIKIVPESEGIEYYSHVQNIGWEEEYSKSNGQMSGSEGQALRLEAIKIRLTGFDSSAYVQYQAHVENVGWQNWKNEDEIAGTEGRGLRVEALKIKLVNVPDKSIQYRVHVQNVGWQEWKTDGALAGTTNRALRIEAIEIKLVDKVENASKKGIDVSTYQNNIDWAQVKADGVDFAMIRAGFRGYGISSDGTDGKLVTDDYFYRNIQNAIANNIDVGVYFFTQAKNEQEAIEEANYTINLIKNYKITYPVAIDTEPSSHPYGRGRADLLTVEERTNVVKAFCNTIRNAGYEPMVYASKWWFIDRLDVSQLTDYAIWLAHYTGASQDDPFAKPSNYGGEYVMWQYTDEGTVNGVLGNVDMNVTIPKNNVGINISNIQSVGTSTENNQDKKVKIFY